MHQFYVLLMELRYSWHKLLIWPIFKWDIHSSRMEIVFQHSWVSKWKLSHFAAGEVWILQQTLNKWLQFCYWVYKIILTRYQCTVKFLSKVDHASYKKAKKVWYPSVWSLFFCLERIVDLLRAHCRTSVMFIWLTYSSGSWGLMSPKLAFGKSEQNIYGPFHLTS